MAKWQSGDKGPAHDGQRGSHALAAAHPVLSHHLAALRAEQTPPAEFRRLVHRVSTLILCEATRDLELRSVEVQTPLTVAQCRTLRERIRLVPILRAGLGMVDAALD